MNMLPGERFYLKVDRSGGVNSCWIWTACTDYRYGLFSYGGRQVKAHRFSYELAFGGIPDGMEIDHLCRVTRCVNPNHLEAVTHAENMSRSHAYNRRKTHCKMGHPYSGDNLFVRKNGNRECRTCMRASLKRWRESFTL